MNQASAIDFSKFFMSIFVVAIHIQPLYRCKNLLISNVYNNMIVSAVPFFFLASGFLLAQKRNQLIDKGGRSISIHEENVYFSVFYSFLIKIIKLYLIWSAIYFPLAIYDYVSLNTGHSILYYFMHYIRGLIFTGEHYNSWMLWYLLSVIYAMVMILFLLKKRCSFVGIAFVGSVVYIISLFFDYVVSAPPPPESLRNISALFTILKNAVKYTIGSGRILKGLFYMPMGMLLANKQLPKVFSYFLFIFGFIVCCSCSTGIMSEIFRTLYVIGMFSIISKCRLKFSSGIFMRKMSIAIYFTHMYVWSINYKLLYGKKTFGMEMFLITIALCLIIALLYASFSCHKILGYGACGNAKKA